MSRGACDRFACTSAIARGFREARHAQPALAFCHPDAASWKPARLAAAQGPLPVHARAGLSIASEADPGRAARLVSTIGGCSAELRQKDPVYCKLDFLEWGDAHDRIVAVRSREQPAILDELERLEGPRLDVD